MEYIRIKGSKAVVEDCFSDYGIDADSANAIVSYLHKNSKLLRDDESVQISTDFTSVPPGSMGFMLFETNYYINLKISTIVVAALLADISFAKGACSVLLELCGFSKTAITALSEENGEKCIVRETLACESQTGTPKILEPLNGECCNIDLSCKLRIEGKCCCTEKHVREIYNRLAERNMFKPSGECFKYQW